MRMTSAVVIFLLAVIQWQGARTADRKQPVTEDAITTTTTTEDAITTTTTTGNQEFLSSYPFIIALVVVILVIVFFVNVLVCSYYRRRIRERLLQSIRRISRRDWRRGTQTNAEYETPEGVRDSEYEPAGEFEYDYAVPEGENESGYEVPVTAPQPDQTARPKGVKHLPVEPGHKAVQPAVSVESIEDAGYIFVPEKKRDPKCVVPRGHVERSNLGGGLGPGTRGGGREAELSGSRESVNSIDSYEGYIQPALPDDA